MKLGDRYKKGDIEGEVTCVVHPGINQPFEVTLKDGRVYWLTQLPLVVGESGCWKEFFDGRWVPTYVVEVLSGDDQKYFSKMLDRIYNMGWVGDLNRLETEFRIFITEMKERKIFGDFFIKQLEDFWSKLYGIHEDVIKKYRKDLYMKIERKRAEKRKKLN